LRTAAADVVEDVYIIAIVVIIGLMVLHWLLDLYRHLRNVVMLTPQVVRMRPLEVAQHTMLTVSFILLVISGFALRYSEGWISSLFFGWEGGFEVRGVLHRVAAIVFMLTIVWHLVFIVMSTRGRRFLRDIWPSITDFREFGRRILYNIGVISQPPRFGRFSYVEKAEYWALVWGTVIMIVTGTLLWFDNWFIEFLPKGVLDVSLVIHYWEAWLATLAIAVWHLYSTVFSPHVYPMNPSWLTGKMPDTMYEREHPEHIGEARQDTESYIKKRVERMRSVGGGTGVGEDGHPPDEPPAR
jgi:cytochrome b subunit of formate dehydrogenase